MINLLCIYSLQTRIYLCIFKRRSRDTFKSGALVFSKSVSTNFEVKLFEGFIG